MTAQVFAAIKNLFALSQIAAMSAIRGAMRGRIFLELARKSKHLVDRPGNGLERNKLFVLHEHAVQIAVERAARGNGIHVLVIDVSLAILQIHKHARCVFAHHDLVHLIDRGDHILRAHAAQNELDQMVGRTHEAHGKFAIHEDAYGVFGLKKRGCGGAGTIGEHVRARTVFLLVNIVRRIYGLHGRS